MLEALQAEGARYIVIGGTAAAIGGVSHATFDLDITPDRERANLDRVAAALLRLHAKVYGVPDEALGAFRLDGRTLSAGSSWKFITDHGELDVVLDPDGTKGFEDLVRRARPTLVHGMVILVASLEDVIRSKEAANRPRDRAVLEEFRHALELKRRREDSDADV
jgi:hypothetical protein